MANTITAANHAMDLKNSVQIPNGTTRAIMEHLHNDVNHWIENRQPTVDASASRTTLDATPEPISATLTV